MFRPKTSDLGRQQRLQAIGAFVEPLDSRWADARFKVAFKHYAAQLSKPPATEEHAQDALDEALTREVLIVSGAEPCAPSQLPAPGKFAKLRLPGGFAYDSLAQAGYPVPQSHRYEAEKRFFDANPLVGAIPIIARVEQRFAGKDDWLPCPSGIQVHFQLVEPEVPPTGDAAAGGELRARTVVKGGTGPKGYVDAQMAAQPARAGDPQVDNCPEDRGGKRKPGAGVAADYFETKARSGFNDHRPDPYLVPTSSTHAVAVMTSTNEKGEAGVILTPSRQGGDRFKIRAFLDPIGPGGAASDGTDASAVRAETGTMVVWKTLRVSGYHQFDYPEGIAAADGVMDDIDFQQVAKAFSPAYMDLVVERTAAKQRHVIGDAFWRRAAEYARKHTPALPPGVTQRYDIALLFPDVNATASQIDSSKAGLTNALRVSS